MTKLENKLTNKEIKNIKVELKDLLKEYVENKKLNVRNKIIEKVVDITNDLYSKQKQHTKFYGDQTYYGLKEIKNLFKKEDEDFTSIFMRQSFNGNFIEYEISGSTNVITFNEYLNKIKHSIKNQLEKIQESSTHEHKILLRCIVVFKKINNEFERYIKYIDSDGIIMRYGSNIDKTINNLYLSLLKSYEDESNKLRGSNFIFSSVDLSYLQVIKINFKKVGTYIETPKWLSNKKAIINPYNIDDNFCFAWSIIISMHYNEINRDHNRISKLKEYIEKYNWGGIKFPTDKSAWDKFEKQNTNIALV